MWAPVWGSFEFAVPGLEPCHVPGEPRLHCTPLEQDPYDRREQLGGWVAYESWVRATREQPPEHAGAGAGGHVAFQHDDVVLSLDAVARHVRSGTPALYTAPCNWTALSSESWHYNPRMPWWELDNGRYALAAMWNDESFAPFRPLFPRNNVGYPLFGHAYSDHFVINTGSAQYGTLRALLAIAARHRGQGPYACAMLCPVPT